MGGILGVFSPSIGTPSFTQGGQGPTSNPLSPPWNVPGNILNMDDLLEVNLRNEFSAEANQVKERMNHI